MLEEYLEHVMKAEGLKISYTPEQVGTLLGVGSKLAHQPEEVGPLLGLGRNSVYALIRSGNLRSIRVGRRILVPTSAILDFLNGGK